MDDEVGHKFNPNSDEISGRASRTPEFLNNAKDVISGKNQNESNGIKGLSDEANNARNNLKAAEKAAGVNETGSVENGLNSVREKEENVKDKFYSGRGTNFIKKGKGLRKAKLLKKAAPLVGGILAPIFLVGALMIGGSSMQLFAWVANVNNNLNQSSAVLALRSNFILKRMLNSHYDVERTDIYGKNRYKIPDSLRKKMKKNNIDVVDTNGTDGKKLRLLVYNESDGTKIPIVASDSDLSRIPSGFSDAELGDITLSDKHFTLDVAKRDLSNFRVNFDTATTTMTGRAAGWFNSLTNAFLKRVGGDNPRSKLKKLGDDATQEEVEESLYKNKANGAEDANTSGVKKEEQDGDEVKRSDVTTDDFREIEGTSEDANGSLKVGNTDTEKIKAKLKTVATKAALGSNVACAALRAVGAINAVVAGIQLANIINFALQVLEASDGTRMGEMNNTIHTVGNILNTSTESIAYDTDGEKVTYEGATTESKGFLNAFSTKNIVPQDEAGALMVNREAAVINALHNMDYSGLGEDFTKMLVAGGTSTTAFATCLGIQAAAGIVDAGTDIILLFTTVGIGNAVKAFLKGVYKTAVVTAAVAAITLAITAIAPMVASWLGGNLATTIGGEVGGFALDAATQFLFVGNLTMISGVNASRGEAAQFYSATREIRDEWAFYDRATLSPFDATNQNTFMGSIARSMLPIINSTKRLNTTSLLATSFDAVGSSIANLSGQTVSAANDTDDFKLSLYEGDSCTSLASANVDGSVYCIKYGSAYTDDLVTRSSEEIYESVAAKADNFDGVDSNGVPKIKDKSDLAKYIVSCMTNDAQPGEVSAVVEGYLEGAFNKATNGSTALGALISIGSGFIPMSGALDAVDAGEQLNNLKWNNQTVCSDPQYKDYSDYSIDSAALETIGVIPQSSVSVFLDEYYKKSPLDNSPEGIIARYSGLTKEEVTDTLALIDYINYIANYNPSERYAFGGGDAKSEDGPMFDNENDLDGAYIMLNEIVYADVRNRSFAV